MRRRTLRDDNVSIGGNDSHPVRIQQLPISLSHLKVFSEPVCRNKGHLAKLELEVALLVEDLDVVVVGVRHHDLVVGGDCDTTWLA